MKRIFLTLFSICFAAPVLAQQDGEPAMSKLSVSMKDCQRLVKHKARNDVAYKPGVDVRGKKVRSADLNPTQSLDLPKEITIDFGLDLAGRYGIGAASNFDATAGIGTIKYDLASGGLTYNGKRLYKDDARAIEQACEERLKSQ